MSTVAILGAGPFGGAIAATLAWKRVCSRVLLLDDAVNVAAGKALDILQSCPLRASDTRLSATSDAARTAEADVIVVADRAADSVEWQGESGLAMMARALAASPTAPVVFAGATQAWLLERTASELGRPPSSLIGSAALAFEGAVRAIAALEADAPARDVTLQVVGRPPDKFVVSWDVAVIAGEPANRRLDAPGLRRMDARLRALWPPGPLALASAASAMVQALLDESGRTLTCLTLSGSSRGVTALPARISADGVAAVAEGAVDARARLALGG